MKNEFVPYTQARALKKLGFDEYCLTHAYYMKGSHKLIMKTEISLAAIRDHTSCKTPLYQQAFRWFREKYGLIGWVEGNKYCIESNIVTDGQLNLSSLRLFKTHEEAELSCLKKLIEIVNQNKEDD
jgi:hypothetical protein